uniref:Copia protein n=1 Tax=Tanacetum cinerariifolium TaxID=118510 RepID=A0A6L2KRW8_TANCI|nr:copia protein [Tanacetum cinerariifolium]
MVDNTLFTKKSKSDLIIVQIYVDDIIYGSTSQNLCDDFEKIMHGKFEMSMMRKLNFFLGLQIKRMEERIFFNQSKYIKEMLKKFGLEDSKPTKTSMSTEIKLTKDDESYSVYSSKYRGCIGRIRDAFSVEIYIIDLTHSRYSHVEDSRVTYTDISSPFEDLSDIGSLRVIVLGYDGLPMIPQDPYVEAALQASPSPDYVIGLKEPEQAPPSPVYPLPAAVSPTTDSQGYIPEEDDKDPEKDPDNYPSVREDDNEAKESSEDDADAKEEDEDDEEDEEHPALADSVPPPVHCVTARMSVRAQTPISLLSDVERAEAPSTSQLPPLETPPFLPIPLPTLSPPMLLPSLSHKADALVVTLLPRKRSCIALGPRFKVSKSSSALTARPAAGLRADYEFVVTLEDKVGRDLEREVEDGGFVSTNRQDTDEIYGRLDDAQDDMILARKAWVQSMGASDLARAKVMSLRTTVLGEQSMIVELRATDHTQKTQLVKAMALLKTLQTQKMAPKITTRPTPATTSTATTIPVTCAQVKALIDQGVADALAVHDADRSRNGEDIHDFRTGVRRQAPLTRECTYQTS